MKLTKKLVLAAVVVPLTLGSASALAFGGKGKDNGGKCGGFNKSMLRQLELTDEQQSQMKELRQSAKQNRKSGWDESRRAEMQSYQAELDALILSDSFDQQAALVLASKMVEKQTERRVEMMEKQHQMLSILTPEQKAKYQELRQEKMQQCVEKRASRSADNA
ncbi:CpxP family protein [Vibrio sonorensis]|uniref:CpxP family protein n=1 Tax=Vibrio sonorensis TaxID=1004316 RepID=UPI0008D94325|nr:CpxP family protein [Vibrio sonorensis]